MSQFHSEHEASMKVLINLPSPAGMLSWHQDLRLSLNPHRPSISKPFLIP